MTKITIATFGEQYLVGPIYISALAIPDNFFRTAKVIAGREFSSTHKKLEHVYINKIDPEDITSERFITVVKEYIIDSLNAHFKFWKSPIEIYTMVPGIDINEFSFTEKLQKEIKGNLKLKMFNTLPKLNRGLQLAHSYSQNFFLQDFKLTSLMYPEIGSGKEYSPEFQKFVAENKHLPFIKKRYKEV